MHKLTGILVALGALFVASQAAAQVAVSEVWRHPDTGTFYALPTNEDSGGRVPAIHTSGNNGQSWTRLPGIPDGAGGELATRTFAVVPGAAGDDVLLAGTEANGLFRSIDSGATWTAWNDAAVGITTISAGQPGDAAWAIASDGALYVSLDDGATWTLVAGIAGKVVTAITSRGDTAWVGTGAGELLQLAAAGTDVTILTGASPFAGAIEALARTDDGTLYFSLEEGDRNGAHLYRTDSADLMTFIELLYEGASMHVRGLAAIGNSVHVLEFSETTNVFVEGEAIDYLVTTDKGTSFTEERLYPIYVNQLFLGPCDGCDPWVLIAHDEGIYMKARSGLGWNSIPNVYEPVAPTPGPEPERTNADLGVRFVSPTADQITRSANRFTLEIVNNGPDDVTNVTAEIQFQTWADTATVIFPKRHLGESVTIDGQECKSGGLLKPDHVTCQLDTLASGDKARIVFVQTLPNKTFQLRIDAYIRAENNRDNFEPNNWEYYQPSVVSGSTAGSAGAGGSGGGGSLGLWGLVALLARGLRRRNLHCLQPRGYSQ